MVQYCVVVWACAAFAAFSHAEKFAAEDNMCQTSDQCQSGQRALMQFSNLLSTGPRGVQKRALMQTGELPVAESTHIVQEDGLSILQQAPANATTASLNEAGYASVAALCCHEDMRTYIERVVDDQDYELCNDGGLSGILWWFDCTDDGASYAELVKVIQNGSKGDCAWVGPVGQCPDMQSSCYLDDPSPLPPCVSATTTAAAATTAAPTPAPTTTATTTTLTIAQRLLIIQSTTTIAPADACTTSVTNLDFGNAAVIVNNLDGLGPDTGMAEEIRYSPIGSDAGQSFDLVVTALTTYEGKGSGNGKTNLMGKIQIRGGFKTTFQFAFQDTSTKQPVTLNEVHMSFFDIDQSDSGKLTERYYVDSDIPVVKEPDAQVAVGTSIDGKTVIESIEAGGGCDNPKDPMDLKEITCEGRTVNQRKRAFMILIKGRSSFNVDLEATCAGTCNSGRIFFFAGTSSLNDLCAAR